MVPDFTGYATRNDLRCSDGLTIRAGAFAHNDQQRVPLVWQHQHNDASNILGYAILEHRDDGVYTRAFFNDTPKAKDMKISVKHGDIKKLSIYANNLRKDGFDVLHGDIREVSLVIAGANPGAYIDQVSLAHGDTNTDTCAIIISDSDLILAHAEGEEDEDYMDDDTIQKVLSTLDEDQADAVHALLAKALASNEEDEDDELDPEDLSIPEVFESFTEEQREVVHHMLNEALIHADTSGGTVATQDKELTVSDIYETFTDEQKVVLEFMVGEAIEDAEGTSAEHSDNSDLGTTLTHAIQEGFNSMPRNVFEKNGEVASGDVLTHTQFGEIMVDAQKNTKSFRESALAHAATYGIDNIELMFPDAKTIGNNPELIARRMGWVGVVLSETKHSPFAKVRSLTVDITADAARAKGYTKGNLKKDEVITMLRRTTGPTTVYKKQKLDRDDIIDIVDMDVVAYLKAEIRIMLEEEIARAILFGDGREVNDKDKIKDPSGSVDGVGIRSIVNDHELYSIKHDLIANVSPKNAVKGMIRARAKWRGTGKPTLFISDNFLTDIMLEEDKFERPLYATEQELADKLRVDKIVTVDVIDDSEDLLAIMVNLSDYTIGANKGGELTSFQQFDIDYNQEKYLTETRISGALTKPYSAIVIRRMTGTEAVPTGPTFAANKITIPTDTGVIYEIDGVVKTGQVTITENTDVDARPAEGYYFKANTTRSWNFTYTAV